MKKKKEKLLISLFVFSMLILPVVSRAARLVPCDNSANNPCDFGQLMNMIYLVIRFVLFNLAMPIAAVMFFYAGFELVTSGGSEGKREMAKNIFTNTAIGLAIAVAAFLIVRAILSILSSEGAWTWIGF